MATLVNAATITTVVGTEVSALGLNPGASPGSYLYKLDVNALAAGEVLFIREYNIISLTAANLLSAAASSFEDGTTGGWAVGGNCTIANTASQGLDGTHALQVTSVAGGLMWANAAPSGITGIPVSPGVIYGVVVYFKSAVSARACQANIQWYNGAGGLIGSQVNGNQITDATGSWIASMGVGVAPVGAAFALMQGVIIGTGAGAEVHYIDCAEIGPIIGCNLLTANQSSLESGTTGWAAGSNTAIASSTAACLDGTHALSLTNNSGLANNVGATTTTGTGAAPVVAGRTYTAVASFFAATSGRLCQVLIQWEQANGSPSAVKATSTSVSVNDNTAGFTQVTITDSAPSDAVFAYIQIGVLTTANTEVHYVDCIGLLDGTSTAWIIGGSQPGGWSIGGVERLNYFGSYVAGSDADPLVETVPILVDVNSRLTLQQKNGSARAIPVKALKL